MGSTLRIGCVERSQRLAVDPESDESRRGAAPPCRCNVPVIMRRSSGIGTTQDYEPPSLSREGIMGDDEPVCDCMRQPPHPPGSVTMSPTSPPSRPCFAVDKSCSALNTEIG